METLTFEDYVQKLDIGTLSQEDQLDTLRSFAKAVHTQFLLEIANVLDKEHFSAVETSIKLGQEVYLTTLKHVVPDYMTLYKKAHDVVLQQLHPNH